ncbi:MAG: hypothetical protein H0U41_03600, partial [Actinobacteria bacterium]|nr:hypothetical protein [Actinomycetota bacterium]
MATPGQNLPEIEQLGRVLVARESLEDLLQRVADAAVRTISRCDSASVSMADDGRVST